MAFQNAITRLLSDEIETSSVLIYLDDLFVFTNSFDQHVKILRQIFQKFSSANIHLHALKCQILPEEVVYLGYSFNSRNISKHPSRCEAIRSWPIPTNAKEVRTILGANNYWIRFVPGYSRLTACSKDLTIPGTPFVWEAKH